VCCASPLAGVRVPLRRWPVLACGVQLRVTFVHAQPRADSLVFVAVNCSVTTSHTAITCKTPPGVGSQHVWTVWLDGQGSYSPVAFPRQVAPAFLPNILTNYTIPLVRYPCSKAWGWRALVVFHVCSHLIGLSTCACVYPHSDSEC
jgi:hypothetical protein